jgi:hypothetical protein
MLLFIHDFPLSPQYFYERGRIDTSMPLAGSRINAAA